MFVVAEKGSLVVVEYGKITIDGEWFVWDDGVDVGSFRLVDLTLRLEELAVAGCASPGPVSSNPLPCSFASRCCLPLPPAVHCWAWLGVTVPGSPL